MDCDICTERRKALVPHRNAPLTETGRLRLARCVVEDGWPLRRAAERFQVSPTTAKRWANRYRLLGEASMADRSSRPRTSPRRTPTHTERRIIKVRVLRRARRLETATARIPVGCGPLGRYVRQRSDGSFSPDSASYAMPVGDRRTVRE